MGLQTVLGELTAHNVALYAISYDAPAVLAGFAAKYGITYPLLSDAGSAVIRQFGLLNEEAAEAVFGIPHPGLFLLDAAGAITQKHFYDNYRERDTGPGLLEHILGIAAPSHGPEARSAAAAVAVRAWFDVPAYTWGQRLWLTVELAIAPGYHVYGRPIPEGYFPLTVTLDPIERVRVGEPQWPETRPFRVAGLDEQVHVYEGTVRVRLPLTFMIVDVGTLTVRATVAFQACTAQDCLLPASVAVDLPLPEVPLIERPQPR